jgi:hypothetical protein
MNNREEMSEGMTPKLPLWSYQVQSNSKLAVRTRKDLEIHLITRSFENEAFKQDLLANPKAVIEAELGQTFPEGIEINVLEETETTLYMVLPSNPYEGLTESELKANFGLTLEDVADWVLEENRNVFLEDKSSAIVIASAWRDEVFKKYLLAHPHAVIEKELDKKIPEGIEIKIFAETTNTLYIVLPRLKDNLSYLAEPQFQVLKDVILIGGCDTANPNTEEQVGTNQVCVSF